MTYQDALTYLDSFINYEKLDTHDYKNTWKLDRIRRLAGLLGNPQKDVRAIHIAGTKGKGSTASIVQSILKKSGFRTGLYTSPHLVSFRERIRISDELISEEAIATLTERLKPAVEKMQDRPSFFEVYTALAYLYFKEKRIDFAVYEVGLGGRLDATNIIDPLVCGITPLSYEHTQILGNTLKEIAQEKAGIIKENSICVSAPQEEEALEVIEETCKQKNAKLILVGRDVLFEELGTDREHGLFNVFGLFGEYPFLEIRLLGSHQIVNAAVGVGIIEALRFYGLTISSEYVKEGIADARWEGRLEIINRDPDIVVDGAQNRSSANALAKAVKKIFNYKNLILVLGVSKDKDISGILKELLPISDSVILTKSKVAERACEPSAIKEHIESERVGVELTSSVAEAIKLAHSRASKDDLVLVTGSLFVVGEAKEFIGNDRCAWI